jgi:hypothetical protein
MKNKGRKSTASRRQKDLGVTTKRARQVGGGAARKPIASPDIIKAPAPGGPVPVPYPNSS